MRLKKILLMAVFSYLVGLQVHAGTLPGRAIIAATRGDVNYAGYGDRGKLEEGMALMAGYSITSGKNGSLCASLSPGALLCVRRDTKVDFKVLEHPAQGLPGEKSDKSGTRRISLKLEHGAIMLHAGEPAADKQVRVDMGRGVSVEASGGSFILASVGNNRTIFVEKGSVTVNSNGSSRMLDAGHRMVLSAGAGNQNIKIEQRKDSGLPYDFEVCRKLFAPLAPLTLDWTPGSLAKLNDVIEAPRGIVSVGNPIYWDDVSPSVRRKYMSPSQSIIVPPAATAGGGKWRRPNIWAWYKRQGTLRGVNYLPRTAVNSIEMWQAKTFDPATIDQELGWADQTGINSVRVFLPYVVWKNDAKGLKKRMKEFLSIADKHGLSTVFVLFDDRQAKGIEPKPGPQPDPVPGVHNSRWVASPGRALVSKDAGSWPSLRKYVQDIVGEFSDDKRVLMWDVYNEAGMSGMGSKSMPLLNAAFQWVREIKPQQPVTAGISLTLPRKERRDIVSLSDVVTVAGYESADQMMGLLTIASTVGRPVICTGWLERSRNNTFKDILPLFSKFDVGWYNWGLVKGRTQLFIPTNKKAGGAKSGIWGQDILDEDGKPFDEEEVRLIKGFSLEKL